MPAVLVDNGAVVVDGMGRVFTDAGPLDCCCDSDPPPETTCDEVINTPPCIPFNVLFHFSVTLEFGFAAATLCPDLVGQQVSGNTGPLGWGAIRTSGFPDVQYAVPAAPIQFVHTNAIACGGFTWDIQLFGNNLGGTVAHLCCGDQGPLGTCGCTPFGGFDFHWNIYIPYLIRRDGVAASPSGFVHLVKPITPTCNMLGPGYVASVQCPASSGPQIFAATSSGTASVLEP